MSSATLDAAAAERVRASFARQGAMATLGAELAEVAAGRVAISLPMTMLATMVRRRAEA